MTDSISNMEVNIILFVVLTMLKKATLLSKTRVPTDYPYKTGCRVLYMYGLLLWENVVPVRSVDKAVFRPNQLSW